MRCCARMRELSCYHIDVMTYAASIKEAMHSLSVGSVLISKQTDPRKEMSMTSAVMPLTIIIYLCRVSAQLPLQSPELQDRCSK